MKDFRIYQQNIQDIWEFIMLKFSHFVKIRSRNSQGSWEFPLLLHILKFCLDSLPGWCPVAECLQIQLSVLNPWRETQEQKLTPNVLPPALFYAALPALWTGCSPSTLINCQQFNSTQCNTINFNSKYVHKLSRFHKSLIHKCTKLMSSMYRKLPSSSIFMEGFTSYNFPTHVVLQC